MYNTFEYFFDLYLTEFIVGLLIISIFIVFISILYLVFDSNEPRNIKKVAKTKKNPKIKYTKEFLKRVKGIDLDLNKKKNP
jgi:predicted membrane protein